MVAFGDIGRDGENGEVFTPETDRPDTDRPDTGRLALDDDGEKLPWLESSDDDEDEGVDSGRIIGFALIGLVALLAILGGIWWASSRHSGGAALADGSTIQAPDAPYKTKPENPGGKQFAGTGDTSFKVGEGQTSEGRLAATKPPEEKPVAPTPGEKPAAEAPAAPVDMSGIGVQVGAYSNRKDAEAGWATLASRNEALSGVKHRIVEGKADIGTVYRLQAVAGDVAGANALCQKLKAGGAACQVKR